nr:immunoglobulin light chain junction region [Macaca mulatta]MOW27714.1 immunoglobulin light chain junction region [Macaca mulatta]MOW27738.1 immunoglobulin light chain junction region [Macaca mulatta]MOW29020.1 immunoglobulin light chain junction region [Macaca mulatta]MOW29287.1 immunoglobulin light chain junction region [Macaca mulatta]
DYYCFSADSSANHVF